ncbi:MAG: hypothetical protein ACAH11_06845 [Sphingomonas sp.]
MTVQNDKLTTENTVELARDTWEAPKIASFEPVAATQAFTTQPGDGVSNNS